MLSESAIKLGEHVDDGKQRRRFNGSVEAGVVSSPVSMAIVATSRRPDVLPIAQSVLEQTD